MVYGSRISARTIQIAIQIHSATIAHTEAPHRTQGLKCHDHLTAYRGHGQHVQALLVQVLNRTPLRQKTGFTSERWKLGWLYI